MATDSSFCIEARCLSDQKYTVPGLYSSDSLQKLFDKVSIAADIPVAQLVLCIGESEVPLDVSQTLQDHRIEDASVLTALRVPEPRDAQVYVCRSTADWKRLVPTENEVRLLLHRGQCFLVSKQFHESDDSFRKDPTLQWDVLHGTYEILGHVADCSWEVHVQRTLRHEKVTQYRHEDHDSDWQIMDSRASFKWKRIALECDAYPDFANMSIDEAKQFMIAHLKSRGFDPSLDTEVAEWLAPFEDMSAYTEAWCVEEGEFQQDLSQAYAGCLTFDCCGSGGKDSNFAAALAGKWYRIEEEEFSDYELNLNAIPGSTAPIGVDFETCNLLGLRVCNLSAYLETKAERLHGPAVGGARLVLADAPVLDVAKLRKLMGF